MGRILRIGTDSVTNYSFEATSAYDEDNPAATQSAWSDSISMDQAFTDTPFATVTAQGCLVTFDRKPAAFLGAMVKVRPTYDADAGEVPAFELWTYKANGAVWTKRRRIAFGNLFEGIPSGTAKVLDLTFFPYLRNVDAVWLTMDPGSVGSPSLEFVSIQLFGQCEQTLRNDYGGGGGDPCADPTDPFYTGFDDDGFPCPGTTFGPPSDSGPTLDLCNGASVAAYRAWIEANIPDFLPVFDAWRASNSEAIAQYCAGNGDAPSPPTPPGSPPALPPLDLCDQTSIDAFRAALGGDSAKLADFESFLDGLEADGFFDFACPDEEPEEQYVDPETLEPADEPDTDGNTPFGSGPGGQPQFPRSDDRGSGARVTPATYATTVTKYLFFFFDNADKTDFLSHLTSELADVQAGWADPAKQVFIFGNGAGPYNPGYVPGAGYTQNALDRIALEMRGVSEGDLVEVLAYTNSVSNPVLFKSYEGSGNVTGSITSSSLVDFFTEVSGSLAYIPGTTKEAGGDITATLAQRKGIITADEDAAVMTLVTAYDDGAHGIGASPTFSDEASYLIGGGPYTIHKHLSLGPDSNGPPGTNPSTTCRWVRIFVKVTCTKKYSLSSKTPFSVSVDYSTTTS